jgi:hypothetical protein
MATELKVSKRDDSIRSIVGATFPEYRGRKITVRVQQYPLHIESYWSGGSRSYFAAVNLRTMATVSVPQNGTPFDGGPIAADGVIIPEGFAIVEHCIFSGKDLGLRIHVNEASLPRLLSDGSLVSEAGS